MRMDASDGGELGLELGGSAGQVEKEQKLRVLTVREWRSQGCLRGDDTSSAGKTVERVDSDDMGICQTRSELSLP
jgi:hypothetical protein